MGQKVQLKNAAVVGETAKAAQVQADVRVECEGGARQLSLTFWAPAWAVEVDNAGRVHVDNGVLAQKEEEDVRRAAERRGCVDVTTVEVLVA